MKTTGTTLTENTAEVVYDDHMGLGGLVHLTRTDAWEVLYTEGSRAFHELYDHTPMTQCGLSLQAIITRGEFRNRLHWASEVNPWPGMGRYNCEACLFASMKDKL